MTESRGAIKRYAHPRDFPRDVAALFARAEDLDIESGPSWYANLVDTVVQEPALAGFYVLHRGSRAVAALPLLRVRRSLGCELHSLSNFYTSLYMPVLAEDAVAADLTALLHGVVQYHPDVRRLHFAPLDPQAPSSEMLAQALRETGFIKFDYFCFNNWYLPVCQDWAAYLASREGRLRSTLKRTSAKLRAGNGSLEIITGGPDLEAALADYQQVYEASWKSPEPFVDFIPGLVRTGAMRGWLRLGIVRMGSRAIAAQIWLIHQRRACIFKLAYDEAYKAYSPGTLLTARMMQYVQEVDRVNVVDYLIGDDAYKRSWMSNSRERMGVVAYRRGSLLGLLGALRELVATRSKPLRRRLWPWPTLSPDHRRRRQDPAPGGSEPARPDRPSR
jgi:Acetyltransferase (GNAT) domain